MDSIPFLQHGEDKAGKQTKGYEVDFKRISEAALIAVTAAVLTMYGTQASLTERLSALSHDIQEVKNSQKQIIRDLYIPRVTSRDSRELR